MIFKLIGNVWRYTRREGQYWEELKVENMEYKWDEFADQ